MSSTPSGSSDDTAAANPKSPRGGSESLGSQPFIYPIRSAVSVKARTPGSAAVGSDGPPTPRSPLSQEASISDLRRSSTRSSYGFPPPHPKKISNGPPVRDESQSGQSSKHSETTSSVKTESEIGDVEKVPLNGPDTTATEELNDQEKEELEERTQMRFKHVETDEGHMVVTGRDGVLLRCEDEPIHIPGAVQSFGCMVVLREEGDGSLVVRQASENTASIIGMTPSHLFKLDSFLDCLEDDQADLLWDTIESLEESEEALTESGPQVFQLSGFGQPSDGVGKARARMHWQCWCAAHRSLKAPETSKHPGQVTILEFEPMVDRQHPLSFVSPASSSPQTPGGSDSDRTETDSVATIATTDPDSGETEFSQAQTIMKGAKAERGGLDGMPYVPTVEQIRESTVSTSKPIKALSRLRQKAGERTDKRPRPRRAPEQGGGPGMPPPHIASGEDAVLDMFGILTQINEQLTAQTDLQSFLKVVVSIVRELTDFSRVMVYQFDDQWNGQVVCELVNIRDTHDLYRGLNFPATDIPKQARDLYRINKVRLLYDRDLPSARMVCRDQSDLKTPVDMTHSFLRAMSPIHVKYLANMGVRASMSCSIMAFNQLWGLIALHTYGEHGHRVAFPMRQLLRLISDSVSRNIERLSYTRRLQSRKLINTLPTSGAPSGYILTKAEDLLELFDADFGVIAIGSECKILGSMSASQEVLALTEYLRLKAFATIISTSNTARDFPDMSLPEGLDLEFLSGVLYIPLSEAGADFIVFIRRAQTRTVSWAGKPFKEGKEGKASLEPRKSFKLWNETVTGTCRAWKDEELETASVLCLVYGKFITVWRSKEAAMQVNQLNRLLLSNASHEVRTPLHHLVSYLELALDGPLDPETRENLNRGRIASKSLLFTINDLLDISRAEQGKQLFLKEPFDLAESVREAVEMHEWEAKRRKINFKVSTKPKTCLVLGDRNRLRQVLVNTTTNSLHHTGEGGKIIVEMKRRHKEEATLALPEGCDVEVELSVTDTGSGIPREKLEAIFREFEQVESVIPQDSQDGSALDSRRSSDGSTTVGADSEEAKRARDLLDDERLLGPEGPSKARQGSSQSGLGVGLAVVARIIRNLNGQLRVDSTVGVGSRFTYVVPFQSTDGAQAKKRETVESGDQSKRMARSNSQGSLCTVATNSSGMGSELDSLVEAIGAPPVRKDRRRSTEDNIGKKAEAVSGPRGASAIQSRRPFEIDGQREVAGSRVPLRASKIDPHTLDGGSQASDDSKPSAGSRDREPSGSSLLSEPKARDSVAPLASPSVNSEGKDSFVSVQSRFSALALRRSNNSTPTPKPKAAREPVSPLRALVVEDDPINRTILKKRLSMDGHTVLLAMNGEEGFRTFESRSNGIDCVLMDLQMPICNGQDSCKRIRALERERGAKEGGNADRPASHVLNGRVPIFAVSATLTPAMRGEMVEIGMDGWILKPVDFSRLSILLRGVTEKEKRDSEQWTAGKNWEKGGWFGAPQAGA